MYVRLGALRNNFRDAHRRCRLSSEDPTKPRLFGPGSRAQCCLDFYNWSESFVISIEHANYIGKIPNPHMGQSGLLCASLLHRIR